MDFGLLWYDDSPGRSLADKVARAAAQYESKFGQPPTICLVNPAMLNGHGDGKGKAVEVGGVRVQAARTVLLHHFLVGVEEARRNGRGRRSSHAAGDA